jgi:hypothetical protein
MQWITDPPKALAACCDNSSVNNKQRVRGVQMIQEPSRERLHWISLQRLVFIGA